MLNKLKDIAKTNKTIVENFSFLAIIQVFNLVIPLIAYPYLIRTLGIEVYGIVVFAQAIVGYLLILVSFGFNISATKQVSVNREDKEKLSEIISSVIIIKFFLFVISFIIVGLLINFIPQIKGFGILFILSMWSCLYDILFPVWYFQGIEKMKYVTFISIVSRIIFLGLIFIFINSPSDFLFVPILYGVGALISGVISITLIFGKEKIKFKWQSTDILKYYFKDSVPIFVSNLSISIYASTNKVIIGTFIGMGEVTFYDLAEKIIMVLKIPQSIFGQVLFPKISREKNLNFIKKVFKISIIGNIILFIIVLIFSDFLAVFIGGKEMINSVIIINILAITIPIIAMSNIFGIQMLIPFGYDKKFSQIIIASSFFYLFQILIVWIISNFSIINISIIIVNTELVVTSVMYYYCKKYNLWS